MNVSQYRQVMFGRIIGFAQRPARYANDGDGVQIDVVEPDDNDNDKPGVSSAAYASNQANHANQTNYAADQSAPLNHGHASPNQANYTHVPTAPIVALHSERFVSNFVPRITGPAVVTQLGGQQVKLLTDDDVLAEIRDFMSNMETAKLTPILRGFQNAVQSLISFAAEIVGDDEESAADLDRTRRLISFCPPEEMFIRAKDKIWAVRDHILKKDLKYFIDRDYSNMIKRDQKQELLENIVMTVKDYAALMSTEKHEALWTKCKIILHWVAKYMREREAVSKARAAAFDEQ